MKQRKIYINYDGSTSESKPQKTENESYEAIIAKHVAISSQL